MFCLKSNFHNGAWLYNSHFWPWFCVTAICGRSKPENCLFPADWGERSCPANATAIHAVAVDRTRNLSTERRSLLHCVSYHRPLSNLCYYLTTLTTATFPIHLFYPIWLFAFSVPQNSGWATSNRKYNKIQVVSTKTKNSLPFMQQTNK